MRHLRIPVLFVLVTLVVSACTSSEGGEMLDELGEGEGELDLIIWAGYAEDGSAFPEFDWVTPFEEETGCIVNATVQADSANGVQLLRSGEYDGGASYPFLCSMTRYMLGNEAATWLKIPRRPGLDSRSMPRMACSAGISGCVARSGGLPRSATTSSSPSPS